MKANLILAAAAALISAPFGLSQANAGDITAEIQNGHLFIYGTDDDSSILIQSGASDSQISITGRTTTSGESTFVNDQENGVVVLDGWTRGIFIYNYGGSDEVEMQNLESAGPVTIDQGWGDDQLMIGTDSFAESLMAMSPMDGETASLLLAPENVKLNSYLLVYAGDGHDDVMVRNTHVARTTTVDLGPGDDYFSAGGGEVGQTIFGNNTFLLPSIGADEVMFERVMFDTNVVIDDATGPLTLNVTDTEVAKSAFVYATPDDDMIMANNWNMGDFLLMITEAGNDRVAYSGDTSNASFYTGVGDDMVELDGLNSGNIIVQTASGNDRIWLSSSNLNRFDLYGSADDDYFKVRSTSAEEGYVYGAQGTDEVEKSTLYPNMINRYRQYSIEVETTSVQ